MRIEQRTHEEDAEDHQQATERGDDLYPSTFREGDHAGSDGEKGGCDKRQESPGLTAGDLRGTHVHAFKTTAKKPEQPECTRAEDSKRERDNAHGKILTGVWR